MSKRLVILGVLVLILAVVGSASLFTVHQTQQALVLQFGEWKRTVQKPGLNVKVPFVQNVVMIDRRVLDIDPPVEQVILADQKRLEVDAFARYRIADPLRFYQSVGTEANAETRLSAVVNSALRRVLGNVTLLAVLSEERARVMTDIRTQVNQEAQRFGIEIVDVRIRRADLPEATSQAVFERERTVILAEAQRDAQVLRGEGDNQAIRILADAGARNPEFYQFYRSLEAYRQALRQDNTSLVLSPDSDFFRFFDSMGALGNGASQRSRAEPAPAGKAQ